MHPVKRCSFGRAAAARLSSDAAILQRAWRIMRRFVIHGAVALALIAALAPAAIEAQEIPADTLPSITLPAALERVLRDYERGWAAGDASGLAALFTEDGFVPSRNGWRRGRAAIREQYNNAGGSLRLRAHAYAVQDSVGYIIGAYRYSDSPGGGKVILALRCCGADGQWLIAADLDNANRPN